MPHPPLRRPRPPAPWRRQPWGWLAGLACVWALAGGAQAAPDARILEAARQEQPAFLNTLRELVEIESGSRDIDGVRAMAKRVAARLKALGGEVQTLLPTDIVRLDDTPEQLGPVVKAVFRGTGTARILLIAHMDTVYPRGTLQHQPFRLEGDKAYGLGAADDKQGVALILHHVALLQKLGVRNFGTLTVLLNSDEEISSPGSRQLITATARDQDAVFSFEGSGHSGAVYLATSGIGAVYLSVRGQSAHAGANPEAGVNALYELSHQVLQMKSLSQPELGLKLNWTLSHAGTTRNVIPDLATAQADARALRLADFDMLRSALQESVNQKLLPDSEVNVRFELRRPPLEVNDASRAVARHAQRIYEQELGLAMPVIDIATGGGTDAAFAGLQARGAVIEGLGLTGYGAHGSGAEYVLLDSLVPRLYLTVRLVQDLAAGPLPP
ncbi:glutamate carboxypeptidase [Comamonas serinivorans]|uniref:Glutamate carboxypeptidase n=1 Tax=Comamonas serinivorans TaxID=1082851 RepID=A0A1Y0ESX2_9BURK|nr:glutamate carboxypeptidase [Comamonas serinivorans]ARU06628.1 glutamate carboxypeptidase [Comamonas serinivorans]